MVQPLSAGEIKRRFWRRVCVALFLIAVIVAAAWLAPWARRSPPIKIVTTK